MDGLTWIINSSSSMFTVERFLSLFHCFHNYILANEVVNLFRVDIMSPRCNTPIVKMIVCETGSCWMILDEVTIHKYIHITHKLSDLYIKYYNFGSRFNTTEFCSERITHRCENDTLNDTRTISYSKRPSSEAVNAYGSPNTGSNRQVWTFHW
jgi:hypothetical protein